MSENKTQYDWILGEPVQTDNINYDWVLGVPYILHEVVSVAVVGRSHGYIFSWLAFFFGVNSVFSSVSVRFFFRTLFAFFVAVCLKFVSGC